MHRTKTHSRTISGSCPWRWDRIRLISVGCLLWVVQGELRGQESPPPGKPVVFYAMGDVPYAPEEDELLPRQIDELPDDGAFVIHLGDIKRGAVPCNSEVYIKVAGMLQASRTPLFIIPGDNEWNDCLIPTAAWEFWVQHFMRFEEQWRHSLRVFRQLEREENFAFEHDGVLFLGLNLVGGRVHDPEEWRLRHRQNLEWVSRNLAVSGERVRAMVVFGHAKPNRNHADFFEPFTELAQTFAKPILYLQGDGHVWIHDKPFAVENILRVQVDQGGKAPPVKVTVTLDPVTPFVFDRRLKAE